MSPGARSGEAAAEASPKIPGSGGIGRGGRGSGSPTHGCAHAIASHVVTDNSSGSQARPRLAAQEEGGSRLNGDVQFFSVLQHRIGRETQAIAKLGGATALLGHAVDRIKRGAKFGPAP